MRRKILTFDKCLVIVLNDRKQKGLCVNTALNVPKRLIGGFYNKVVSTPLCCHEIRLLIKLFNGQDPESDNNTGNKKLRNYLQ